MNSKLFGMLLLVAAAASALISTQNAMAGGFVCCGVEMEAEEAGEVENATRNNQSANRNMTGTNSSG